MHTYAERKVVFGHDDIAFVVEESLRSEIFRIAPDLVHKYAIEIHNEHRIL